MGQLTRALLQPQNVYLVDCGGELYVWMGKKSAKFLRYAGFKLAQELMDMMPRGFYGGAESSLIAELVANASTAPKRPAPLLCPEGAESQVGGHALLPFFPKSKREFDSVRTTAVLGLGCRQQDMCAPLLCQNLFILQYKYSSYVIHEW
ncbi:unnamed protein product [Dibothriocephalus latus]|uniref:Gelsolin-like domain-containing protein n=1 Tax=Dibothriocephalus latus TaxID=60516 RepID=A0A3P6R7D7_DIBLA|nr:unnamed protein product [Dibothriocephalus latus]